MSEDDQADTIEFSVPKPSLVGGAPSNSSLVRIDQAALSHRGKVRKNNEDSFLAVKFERRMQTLLSNLPPGNIRDLYSEVGYAMLVPDGMVDAGVVRTEETTTRMMRSVPSGAISTSEAKAHGVSNLIGLDYGEQLLSCTAGLTEMVTNKSIADVLRMDLSAEVACKALGDQA